MRSIHWKPISDLHFLGRLPTSVWFSDSAPSLHMKVAQGFRLPPPPHGGPVSGRESSPRPGPGRSGTAGEGSLATGLASVWDTIALGYKEAPPWQNGRHKRQK